MADSEPDISYSYAHFYLEPEETFSDVNWKADFKGGKFDSFNGHLSLLFGKYVLDMFGITIPTAGMGKISTEKDIIDSARRLIGSFGSGDLERCVGLHEKSIITDSFYFTRHGLSDYSQKDSRELDFKIVTGRIKEAQDFSDEPWKFLPQGMEGPKGLKVEFVPTFQAMRNVEGLGGKGGDRYTITGATFAKQVKNFLAMYDLVVKHIDWKNQRTREISKSQTTMPGEHSSMVVPVAKLIFSANTE